MNQINKLKSLNILFFVITALLVYAEFYSRQEMILVLKPLLIPSLFVLYIFSTYKLCYWYLLSLVFAFISNVLLLFTDPKLLLYGIVVFLLYRIATIIVILKNGDKVALLPVVLASVPFLFMFSYLIYIMITPENPNFYATVINDIIISIFSGIGLSNYVMNDNKENSWLLISTLLFTFLVILFMFDKFYLSFQIFKPLSALVFAFAHYTFYMFIKESQR